MKMIYTVEGSKNILNALVEGECLGLPEWNKTMYIIKEPMGDVYRVDHSYGFKELYEYDEKRIWIKRGQINFDDLFSLKENCMTELLTELEKIYNDPKLEMKFDELDGLILYRNPEEPSLVLGRPHRHLSLSAPTTSDDLYQFMTNLVNGNSKIEPQPSSWEHIRLFMEACHLSITLPKWKSLKVIAMDNDALVSYEYESFDITPVELTDEEKNSNEWLWAKGLRNPINNSRGNVVLEAQDFIKVYIAALEAKLINTLQDNWQAVSELHHWSVVDTDAKVESIEPTVSKMLKCSSENNKGGNQS